MPLIQRREPKTVDGFIPVVAGGEGFQGVRVHQLEAQEMAERKWSSRRESHSFETSSRFWSR